MYRCYLLRNGRIVKADNLDVTTLDEAIAAGRRLLADQSPDRSLSGIEIWEGAVMLYADADPKEEPGGSTDAAPHDTRFATMQN